MAKTYIKDINNENATDWQRSMFNSLSPDVLEKAKVAFTTDKYGNLKKPAGVKAVGTYTGGQGDTDAVYGQTYIKDLGKVNGLHIYANYDSKGNLTGFDEGRAASVSNPVTKVYANDKQYVRPTWDATGQAKPVKGTDTKNGGLFSDFFSDVTSGFDDLVLQNPALRAAALSYYAPIVSEALAPASGEALSGIDMGGVGGSPATWTNAGAADAGLAGATQLANATNAAPLTGTATGADLSAAYDMGAAGDLGAGGATVAPTAADVASTATTAGAGTTAANVANTGANVASAAGNKLIDILPYTTAAGVATGLIQADAAKTAAATQTDAAKKATEAQQTNFETINAQQAPYRATGYNALNEIAKLSSGQTPQYDYQGNIVKDANGNPVMTAGSGYLQHQFDATDLKSGLAPNYDFMLQQGQMTNQRAANMGGGAIGGNALQGLNKYTQDYAGNAYQNAFSNYQTQRNNIYNTLAGIAGIGQTGQTATNTAATNATNAATNLAVGSAAANAAGTVGSANALSNTANNIANNYTLASLLNQGGRVAP